MSQYAGIDLEELSTLPEPLLAPLHYNSDLLVNL
jgi:hypothetical protein